MWALGLFRKQNGRVSSLAGVRFLSSPPRCGSQQGCQLRLLTESVREDRVRFPPTPPRRAEPDRVRPDLESQRAAIAAGFDSPVLRYIGVNLTTSGGRSRSRQAIRVP